MPFKKRRFTPIETPSGLSLGALSPPHLVQQPLVHRAPVSLPATTVGRTVTESDSREFDTESSSFSSVSADCGEGRGGPQQLTGRFCGKGVSAKIHSTGPHRRQKSYKVPINHSSYRRPSKVDEIGSVASASVEVAAQDKRFTGSKGQTRCVATTTRRRPCAYVAVNGTEYCLMHAKYGRKISPSKRQNGQSPRRANLAQKHAKSPYHLLSMLSTDQWYGQPVQVLVGPLQGKNGVVEKWGNGWITVVTDSGPHNRRSFELRLLKTDGSEPSGSTSVRSDARATSPAISEMSSSVIRGSRVSIMTPTAQLECKEVGFSNIETPAGKTVCFDRTATVTPLTPGKAKAFPPPLDHQLGVSSTIPPKKRKTD